MRAKMSVPCPVCGREMLPRFGGIMPKHRPVNKPTAEEWEQAVSNIFAHYPWARKICLNIITEAWRLNTEHIDGDGDV